MNHAAGDKEIDFPAGQEGGGGSSPHRGNAGFSRMVVVLFFIVITPRRLTPSSRTHSSLIAPPGVISVMGARFFWEIFLCCMK